ncbi:MAG TPA: hypothetical protein VM598_10690 [Bdellovibrionota bacterium]|nr:hypothetical protein [Bdellovibrionota bacterium]
MKHALVALVVLASPSIVQAGDCHITLPGASWSQYAQDPNHCAKLATGAASNYCTKFGGVFGWSYTYVDASGYVYGPIWQTWSCNLGVGGR